ncbi:SDR family NAD(P)-dependent oxidoreductase [Haloferax sp. YSSS75]|uniref:SDR family NAD(P)-dependent oxidoreductase n=1 Tax=Haloferax sp. YSSS75 TaxID=3388564 RepID=UPI00398CE626
MTGKGMFDFTGESAIVTGSTKGIGKAIAKSIAEAGGNVLINSRTETDVDNTVSELNKKAEGDIIGKTADVGEPAEIEALVAKAIASFGEVDLLVNNAAVWPGESSMVSAELSDWELAMDVNVRSQFYCSKLVAEHMTENGISGSIVNLTSQTGDRRAGGRGLYGVSKTAINGLTWKLAHELAPHGIRVNGISTASTLTPQLRSEAEDAARVDGSLSAQQVLDELGQEKPIGRLGQPKEIADAVMFLASDRAEYIVGDIIRVSGGGNLQ